MTEQDLPRFTEIMMAMLECYPAGQISPAGLELRFEALKEYSIDQIAQAASTLLKTHRFNSMPTVGDFVAVIDQQTGKIEIDDMAELQAGVVLECLQRFGSSINPQFEDTITMHLMSGRWRYSLWARHVREDDLRWWRQEFIRAYKAHSVVMKSGHFLPGCNALQILAAKSVRKLGTQRGLS